MPFDIDIKHWRTIAEFTAYLRSIPRPSWCAGVTNHNTYIPNEKQWRGLASMRSMRDVYIAKGWTAGPHLFLCAAAPNSADTGIFQMTPLTRPGVHAGACNTHHLGIENVGDFDAHPPTLDQYTLLLAVNRAILEHWGLSPSSVNVHNECMTGRTCPGKYLTGAQIRADLSREWPRPPPVSLHITLDTLLLSSPRATPEQCAAFILSRPHGEYDLRSVNSIVASYFTHASGIDPLLAIAQCIHETGGLTSALSQRYDRDRRPLRNPAGIGVTGAKSTTPLPGYAWDADRGCYRACIGFASWDLSVKAHLGRLLAYALPSGGGTAAQQRMIGAALALRSLPLDFRGKAATLAGLDGRWAVPGIGYSARIASIASAIAGVR